MAIRVNLDLMLVKRRMKLLELARAVEVTVTNLSIVKTNKARGIRFSTLDAICRSLDCQPGDILEYVPDAAETVRSELKDTDPGASG